MNAPLLEKEEYDGLVKTVNKSSGRYITTEFIAERWQIIGYYMDFLRQLLQDCPNYTGYLEFRNSEDFVIMGYIQLVLEKKENI